MIQRFPTHPMRVFSTPGLLATLLTVTVLASAASAEPRRVILDVDPGIDDALAILLALRAPELRVEAITVVAGNVVVDQGTRNALKLVELAGAQVPVARGADRPLVRKLITAEAIHGRDGLGEVALPEPAAEADPRHAVELILDLVRESPGEITLLPVGPLTNVALALRQEPRLPQLVSEIILMGGSIVGGNASPAAEANIYNDPEAAAIVFSSGIPITMVGLGATAQARIERAHLPRLEGSDSRIARYAARLGDVYLAFAESLGFFEGADLHDPLAVGIAIDPGLAEVQPMRIDVETRGEHTYGETVANRFLMSEAIEDLGDRYTITSFPRVEPNADVVVKVDGARFLELFLGRLTQ